MRRPFEARHGVLLAAALTMFIASFAAPRAQQAAAPTPTPTPAPKALVPVSASSVAANPDAYYGENVTMTAAVEQILSLSAFSIDQRVVGPGGVMAKANGKDVLVLAPTLHGAVDLNAYVTVFGEVMKFDPAEVARKAKDYKLDLAPDVVEKYRGRPAVLATAVINNKFVDLAKRLPPPVTAEEQAFDNVMKKVGPAFAALRTAVDGSVADVTAQNVAVLKQAFTDTEAFWKTRGKADATQWAQDARKQVDAIEAGAAGAKWDAAKASSGTLGQACQTCHAAYRERFDDGSYRIKTGTK